MLTLKPTPEYEAAKAELSSNAQTTLNRVVEPAIAADPYHDVKRFHRDDGATIDRSAEGLFVAFRVLTPTVVELLEAIGLKDAPRWP